MSDSPVIRELHVGRHAKLKEVTLPGRKPREVVQVPDSVAFLVHVKETDAFAFVKQLREPTLLRDEATDGTLIEVPAGHIKPGDTPIATIIREAEEELHLRVREDQISRLSGKPLMLSPGVLTEAMSFAIVEVSVNDFIKSDKPLGLAEEDEQIELVLVSFDDFYRVAIMEIRDLKTIFLTLVYLNERAAKIIDSESRKLLGKIGDLSASVSRLNVSIGKEGKSSRSRKE